MIDLCRILMFASFLSGKKDACRLCFACQSCLCLFLDITACSYCGHLNLNLAKCLLLCFCLCMHIMCMKKEKRSLKIEMQS